MNKVPIDFDNMTSQEMLRLARKLVREINDVGLQQYKIVEK